MTDPHYILFSILAASALLAAGYDLKLRRIPNWLSSAILLSGISLHFANSGFRGGLFALAGIGAGAGLLLFPYLLGGMGAGDVKLLAALGALVGAKGVLILFVLSSLFGGVLAIAALLLRDRVAKASGGLLKTLLATHPSGNSAKLSLTGARVMVPYGVAISCGALTLAGMIL